MPAPALFLLAFFQQLLEVVLQRQGDIDIDPTLLLAQASPPRSKEPIQEETIIEHTSIVMYSEVPGPLLVGRLRVPHPSSIHSPRNTLYPWPPILPSALVTLSPPLILLAHTITTVNTSAALSLDPTAALSFASLTLAPSAPLSFATIALELALALANCFGPCLALVCIPIRPETKGGKICRPLFQQSFETLRDPEVRIRIKKDPETGL